MQTYNQFNQGRSIMPLLMNFTTPSQIQDDLDLPPINYNDKTQISYEMRLVCTRSARRHITKYPGKSYGPQDLKNENDDTKSVH